MPLFGKSKKAQEAKKQEDAAAAAAPKPAPYRHVPKHAAADARVHGMAEEDKLAQQKRIMAASQQRLNSMNSNYSVKSNFMNLPPNDMQPKSPMYAASNSSRHSMTGRAWPAVQPTSPAASVPPSRRAQEEYAKLPNPSLVAANAAFASSNLKPTLAVKTQPPTGGGVASSDSGYGSVGQISRPESKAPSTTSKAPSDIRKSQEIRPTPSSASSVNFLPKLDFTPEPSRPPSAIEEAVSPIQTAKPVPIIATRNRGNSNSSSYISRLDPGSDRRSIISTQSKPFDQIDFSKPGQQFVPTSPVRSSTDTAGFARPGSSALLSGEQALQADHTKSAVENAQQRIEPAHDARGDVQSQLESHSALDQLPDQTTYIPAEPKSPRQFLDHNTPSQARVEPPLEIHAARDEQAQSMQQTANDDLQDKPSHNGDYVHQSTETQSAQSDSREEQLMSPLEDGRGRQTDQSATTAFPPIEESRRSSSTSQTQRLEQTESGTSRPRNWSRPSRSSGSQLDERKLSNGGFSGRSAKHSARNIKGNSYDREAHSLRESESEAREPPSVERSEPPQRAVHIEQPAHLQEIQRWTDQGSSNYGESTYNPSTRQPSPNRRQSYAPSAMLERGHATDRSAVAPLAILEGLKVNKRGRILDEEGDPIGELVEGDIIDCVRQKANAIGEVLDDYGRVVGRVVTINRGGGMRSQSPAATVRSRRFSDFYGDYTQRYAMPESQVITPAAPASGKASGRPVQQEDPRQRAADLHAAAARRSRRRSPEAHIELDGSGFAEAAPLVDHSEIFAPPFIPSRSPKRSPAEPEPHTMDTYFSSPPVRAQSPTEQAPRLRKWASRNLEEDREEMQRLQQASQQPAQQSHFVAPPAESANTSETEEERTPRPSTTEVASQEQQILPAARSEPDAAAENFIASDQPKDIFPWMTNPAAPQENGKWSSSMFSSKGEIPKEDAQVRPNSNTVRTTSTVRTTTQTMPFAANSAPLMKHYLPQLNGAPTLGSRTKSNRTSHVPHVKSPLSTHNTTPTDTTAGATQEDDRTPTTRPSSTHTTTSTSTAHRRKTYFTHTGRQSVLVPETKTTTTTTYSKGSSSPQSPTDGAIPPPDVVRAKADTKKKSRWSMSFGKKAK